jgi:hypothetical protein
MREFAAQDVLFFAVLAALFVLVFFYRGSMAQHRGAFGTDDVARVAVFTVLEVLRGRDPELGPLVGVHFPGTQSSTYVLLAPGEARRLADLLEAAADEIAPGPKKPGG